MAQLAGAGYGAARELEQILAERFEAEKLAALIAERDRQFQMDQERLKVSQAENAADRAARAAEREADLKRMQSTEDRAAARYAGEHTPAGPISGDTAKFMQRFPETAGRIRNIPQPSQPMGPDDVGPATPEAVLEPNAGQLEREAVRRAQAEAQARDDDRLEGAATETKRHNQAMESRPVSQGVPVVIQTPSGPAVLNRGTRQAEPITMAGETVGVVPSATERMESKKFSKAAPILSGISELSERINTGQGVVAKMVGGVEKVKAQANLNDDIAEYEALISGFTPMVARALGHTGVLTEQDVQSVRTMFPRPGDSKTLRDRKMNRIMTIIGPTGGDDVDAEIARIRAARKPGG